MSKKDSKNSKLTINDRMLIQVRIAKGESAVAIARGSDILRLDRLSGNRPRPPKRGSLPVDAAIHQIGSQEAHCRTLLRLEGHEE